MAMVNQQEETGQFLYPEQESLARFPRLNRFGRDLTGAAERGELGRVIGRKKELAEMMTVLGKSKKKNPCLIGEAGVGKTAVVEGLASLIAAGQAPATLKGKRIFALDLNSLFAGASVKGEAEQRIKEVIAEAEDSQGAAVLFIDEIHTIVGAGAHEGKLDLANVLKSSLATGRISVIGATTEREYQKYIESDAALARRFQRVRVKEPDRKDSEEIMCGIRGEMAAKHRVEIPEELIPLCVSWSMKYIRDRQLPDKAIDLIDEACSRRKMGLFAPAQALQGEGPLLLHREIEAAKKKGDRKEMNRLLTRVFSAQEQDKIPILTRDDLAEVIHQWQKIPREQILMEPGEKARQLLPFLKRSIKGQDESLAALTEVIKRWFVKGEASTRPVGVFLALGRSGTGKTETARALAEYLFGDRQALVRIDMSEFMESHAVSKLFGSPPGYVGYGEGGQLTNAVKRNPFSVVLFDEMEKAHPQVLNALLQLFEEGTMTDGAGSKVDFCNTIVMLTSNLPVTLDHKGEIGFTRGQGLPEATSDDPVRKKLAQLLRPEFVNRIDEILVYKTLEGSVIDEILDLHLERLAAAYMTSRGLRLEFSKELKDHLRRISFSEEFGARQLSRNIAKYIENAVVDLIFKEDVRQSGLAIDWQDGRLVIQKTDKAS